MDINPRARYEPFPEQLEPSSINVSLYDLISSSFENNSISA